MVKIENVSRSLMTNPLVGVVVAIFLLLIVLAIIRLFQPDFTMGAKLEGHFGTLDGKINLEAYDNHQGQEEMAPMAPMAPMDPESEDMTPDGFGNMDSNLANIEPFEDMLMPSEDESVPENFNNMY